MTTTTATSATATSRSIGARTRWRTDYTRSDVESWWETTRTSPEPRPGGSSVEATAS